MSTAFEGRDKGSIVTPWTDQATALGGIRFRVCCTAAVFREIPSYEQPGAL
jgi:hypothetical protein